MSVHWFTAEQIAAAYAERELSPLELVSALIDRAKRLDPELHAFIRLDEEAALAEARLATEQIASGRRRGPLHGVPVGIKDIIDVAGLPTTCHSRVMEGHIARSDAQVIARLRAAGAIILGKLSTHEFAIGGPSYDLPFPAARNPWNLAHHPGGSSSGSGAGVAAGLFPAALGSDTGGSIRNPASSCGILGLKPTYGVVSRRGVFPLAFTLDHVGPLTWTAGDCALMMQAIAGHDADDPGSAAGPPIDFGVGLEAGVRDLRIGFVRHFRERDEPADPEVTAGLEEAARLMEAEGALVRTITLPSLQEFAAVNRVILTAEAWSVHAHWLRERPGDYGQLTRQRLTAGAFLSAEAYVGAQRRRTQLIGAVNNALREVDVLMCASNLDPACNIEDPAEIARTYSRQARTPFNVTGHPALAMGAGFARNGLPLSVQFVGRTFADATVLRVAAAYQRASGWYERHPNI